MTWPAPGTVRLKFDDPCLAFVADHLFSDTSVQVNAAKAENRVAAREALARGWLTSEKGTGEYIREGDDYRGVSKEGARAVAQAILSAIEQ